MNLQWLRWAAALAAAVLSAGARATTCVSHLRPLGVSQDEARYWARRAHSRDAFFGISSLMKMVDDAPDDVWDLLALTRLGHLAPLDAFVDEFTTLARGTSGTDNLEVLFGADLSELRTEVAAVMALGRYGSDAAREWFGNALRVPGRIFVLARILKTFPPARYDVARGFMRTRPAGVVQIHLTRLRQWRGHDKSWRPLMRGSRLLTNHLIIHRFLHYQNEKGAVTTDLERMGEWVLDQIAPRPGAGDPPPEPIPPHWIKFKASLFDAIDTPPHRQRKIRFGMTEGELTLAGLLADAVRDLLEVQIKEDQDRDESIAGRLIAASILASYAEGVVNLEGGARALGLLFDAIGISFPRGSELKAKFAAHLRAALGNSLREYFPLHGRGYRDADVAEVTEPTHGMHIPRPKPAPERPVTASVTDGDDLPPFADLKPDRVYRVHFARPHAKFSGLQPVVFTETALEQMAAHAEVEPDVWLMALRRGIAGPYRQNGLKPSTFGTRRGVCVSLPAHIKTRFSNYGVTGEFCGGVWTFTGIFKRH